MSDGRLHHRSSRLARLGAVALAALLGLAGTAVAAPSTRAIDADVSRGMDELHAGPTSTHRTTNPADRVPRGWIVNQIRRMTLEEKVGQLFVTYAYGPTADTVDPRNRAVHGVDTARELVDRYKLGGIIYFAWSGNVNNPAQIATLSNGLQEAALSQRMPVPLLISTDQEQGLVTRIGPPATQFPGAMALGAGRSAADATDAARITGAELRAIGINQNYAPVADVNVNPRNPVIAVRSFAEDPQLVADLTVAQVSGYRQAKVAATAKHFPGHGNTATDSHIGVPIIHHTLEEWREIDAPPFEAAVAAGIDAIMTAHIVVPALDPAEDPATLSHPIVTGLLRDELGYDGVVVTDALDMAGVRQHYGDERVPVLALRAGVDMLLMPPDIDLAYNAVLDAVRAGELSERRIEESVYRILRLKYQRGLYRDPFVDVDQIDDVVGTPEHLTQAQRISDATTTLVANDAGLLPLEPGDQDVFVTGWGVVTTQTLAAAIGQRGPSTAVLQTGVNPSQAVVDAAVAQAQGRDIAVVTTMNAWAPAHQGQRDLVRALADTGIPVVVVAVRDAYDVAHLQPADTYLATYSHGGVALESAARVMFAERSPRGQLPVTVPVAGESGAVLYPFGHGLSY
ncbi:glycoside hydrolase family 3 protein [Phytoactinopolyspora limicola]|uniref:glycoside hydrolase family 3 protein n=1 Tax=Phytoactinopolyspora limicola TaxID=2715536 RepID=UPI001A9C8DC6|nr:glycoside hydrolase family 3 protein [Phytoactinopolyspora limicola]